MIFDKNWFKKHQRILLFLLNAPVIKYWGRWCFRIHKFDCSLNTKIEEISTNFFSFNKRKELWKKSQFVKTKLNGQQISKKDRIFYTKQLERIEKGKEKDDYRMIELQDYDFRTHCKFSKRAYYAFYPLWFLCHWWDMLIANKFAPQLNLGFDEFYPDAHPESTSVDGRVYHSYDEFTGTSWSTIIAAAGTASGDSQSGAFCFHLLADNVATTNRWRSLTRSIFLFDTSSIEDSATISSVVFSIWGYQKEDNLGMTPDLNVYSSAPASNTALAAGDFDSLGTTAFCDTAITYSGFSISGYNDLTFNSSGLASISKIGVTKLGCRNANCDVSGTTPAWIRSAYSQLACYYADDGAGYRDPKLVVTVVTKILQVNIGDAWKNVTKAQVNIGDVWKPVTKGQVNIGDTWKTIF